MEVGLLFCPLEGFSETFSMDPSFLAFSSYTYLNNLPENSKLLKTRIQHSDKLRLPLLVDSF